MGNPESGREYFGHGLPRGRDDRAYDEFIRKEFGEILKGNIRDERDWGIYDLTLDPLQKEGASYARTFSFLTEPDGLPRISFKEYIEDILRGREGQAIGIDFGGVGSRVFRGFSKGFFKRTLGLTLGDGRGEDEKKIDRENGHDVIGGNMFDPIIRKRIKGWLNGQKVDLIFERMEGGLDCVNHDMRFVREALKQIYFILREGGVAFIQQYWYLFESSGASAEQLYSWAEGVNRGYEGRIEITLDPQSVNDDRVKYGKGAMMIRKLEGAPEQLPLTELLRKTGESVLK